MGWTAVSRMDVKVSRHKLPAPLAGPLPLVIQRKVVDDDVDDDDDDVSTWACKILICILRTMRFHPNASGVVVVFFWLLCLSFWRYEGLL